MDNTISPESFLLDNKVKNIENTAKNSKGLKEAAKEFESFFVYYMLKKMRDTLPKSGMIPEGKGQEVYTTLYDQELAKTISERGEFGLSKLIINQLKK